MEECIVPIQNLLSEVTTLRFMEDFRNACQDANEMFIWKSSTYLEVEYDQ